MNVPIALTIAGSDPSGGAGLQGDLKTFHQHGVYGAAVVTLLTVQNTQRVSAVETMPIELVLAQIDAVLEDLDVRAIKTGALGTLPIAPLAERLARTSAPLVIDPVLVASHGERLTSGGVHTLDPLLAIATLVTPNLDEAEMLTGSEVRSIAAMKHAARELAARGALAVLVKGGHLAGDPIDVLFAHGEITELASERIVTRAGHGTGCAYASAIAARLARGEELVPAVAASKRWLTEAIRSAPPIGRGIGPIDHLHAIDDR
jgi:hydroxymethylpyrimidine/phosphomethylpyrimidine kinase